MSTNTDTRCPHCGGKYHFTDKLGNDWRSPLCREREAHAKTREELEQTKRAVESLVEELGMKHGLVKAELKKSEAENAKLKEAYEKSVERDDFLTQQNAKLRDIAWKALCTFTPHQQLRDELDQITKQC